jgi:toxin ParE1/3/4
MSWTLIVRPEARDDLTEVHDYYETLRPGLGADFQDEADATVARVVANPLGYAADRLGVRKALLHRFPYVVIYRLIGTLIEVLAVIHTSRHPRSWRSRL